MKKPLCFISMLLAPAIMLAGCSGTGNKTAEVSGKTVALVMYLLGDKPNDYDQALAQVNKMLKEDINAELQVRFLGWGEYAQKYPMLLSSGEVFDLIYVSGSNNYKGYATKGGYMDITELMPEYAPKSYAALRKEILDSVKIDDRIYCLPANYYEINPAGYVIRGDLRAKYNLPEITSFDLFLDYLDAVSKNEQELIPFNASSTETVNITDTGWCEISRYSLMAYDLKKNDPKELFSMIEKEEELMAFYKKMRQGYLNGYWPRDVVMNSTSSQDAFVNGTSAASITNLKKFNDVYSITNSQHPEWKPEWYRVDSDKNVPVLYTPGPGVAVAKTSKNPEKALMLLDLLNQDERYFNLLTYGIEGKHYVINEDGKLDFPQGVTSENTGFLADQAGNWGWRNENLFRLSASASPAYEENEKKLRETGEWNAYLGFTLDNTNIKNEMANVTSVLNQYEKSLRWGAIDPEEGYAIMKKALKDAGLDKVQAEVLAQTKIYWESNGN